MQIMTSSTMKKQQLHTLKYHTITPKYEHAVKIHSVSSRNAEPHHH